MKKLLAFLVLVGSCIALAATAARAASAATCQSGYSWGQRLYTHALPSVLSGDITDIAATTPAGTGTTGLWAHSEGHFEFQYVNGSTVYQVQLGIEEQNNSAAQFYVEEAGATTPPSGWYHEQGSYYAYWFGSPNVGSAYFFEIENEGGNNFQLVAPGYTSPVITLGGAPNTSGYTNEVYANQAGACQTSNFEFTSPSPWYFGTYSYGLGQGTVNSFFYNYLVNSSEWAETFPSQDCQFNNPPCLTPTAQPVNNSVVFVGNTETHHAAHS